MKTRILRSNEGFTLVELMVVVAIIGVLTSVAIPNFRRYQAKSKTSEAKINLASIYSAQTTLQSDYDHFAHCLEFAGYDGPGTTNYYATGFAAATNTAAGYVRGEGGTGCVNASTYQWAQGRNVGGASLNTAGHSAQFAGATVSGDGETFTASAIGYIDKEANTAAAADLWTIDEDKAVTQVRVGY